jgi:hypothetical protein
MRRFAASYCLAALAALCIAPSTARAASIIAHWSFDTPAITTDGSGNIVTAADSTATHNATTQLGGTGVNIASVAGQFGQAASFGNANQNGQSQANNAWLSFPQLTEISGPSGGDFTVAAWVNVPPEVTTWDDNPILVDWGNAPTNTRRFTYWFQLDNVDSNLGLRPRAQMRATNAPPDATSIDIVATTLSSAQAGTAGGPTTFDDSSWHHLAWTWTKSAGQMRFYTDGVLRHTQTSTQTGSNLDLAVSDSTFGALGAKRDNNRYFRGMMDEVYVISGVLSDAEVLLLKQTNVVVPEPTCLGVAALAISGGLANRTRRRRRG